MKTETTVHGTLLQVEFGDEVANINTRQIIGFYDFSYLKPRGHNQPDPVRKMNNSGRS